MAYGLPTRGQADWDDELNNSFEYLKSTADSAKSTADGNAAAILTMQAELDLLSTTDAALIVVSGGTVALDSTQADGYLVGYRVTATTTIAGSSFEPGSYIFERDTSVGSGWTYRTLDAATAVPAGPDGVAPTGAPDLDVDNSSATQLVATFSGGIDNIAITQHRTRIDGGAWTVGTSPRTFTGLAASTSYTIDAQAGDAAGNWSPSATWTGSTAAAWTPASLPGQLARYTVQDPAGYTESGGVISQLTDMSGGGRHLTQATVGNRPDLVAASLNGHPVAQFSATDLMATGAAAFSDTGSFTMWAIIRKDGEYSATSAVIRAGAASGHSAGYGWNSGAHTFGILYRMDYSDVTMGHVVTGTHADALAVTIEGGSQTQRSGVFTGARDGLSLSRPIANFNIGGAPVSVAECGVLDGAMLDADWAALHDYAISRYGVD